MSQQSQLPNRIGPICESDSDENKARDAERRLKSFRYVVGAVNDDALKAWSDLWDELRSGVTPAGLVLPKMSEGFKPPCGWPEFLEKFWLLKHYLDYVHRFCRQPS